MRCPACWRHLRPSHTRAGYDTIAVYDIAVGKYIEMSAKVDYEYTRCELARPCSHGR